MRAVGDFWPYEPGSFFFFPSAIRYPKAGPYFIPLASGRNGFDTFHYLRYDAGINRLD